MGTTAEIIEALKNAIPNVSVQDERFAREMIERYATRKLRPFRHPAEYIGSRNRTGERQHAS